ncbi:hypothetical protein Mnod_3192 [Methylobacterium nodulans ORS 2060]|uniref:Uncharacterized protein n=1 Tax=Methylobacterium nodulans (strain LMG 21967 / CNCM I-2342 / ORS 2060) TaxID=460265 RepID=B8IJS1_METNO|nr:hypothetical protein Mnod_3192 [Methylobacterium nodulans ORS 2060]
MAMQWPAGFMRRRAELGCHSNGPLRQQPGPLISMQQDRHLLKRDQHTSRERQANRRPRERDEDR